MDIKEELTKIIVEHFPELSNELLDAIVDEMVTISKHDRIFRNKIVCAVQDDPDHLDGILKKAVEISQKIKNRRREK